MGRSSRACGSRLRPVAARRDNSDEFLDLDYLTKLAWKAQVSTLRGQICQMLSPPAHEARKGSRPARLGFHGS